MDGLLDHRRLITTPHAAPPPLLGILYAEDFDDLPAVPAPSTEPELATLPSAPIVSPQEIERACAHAVAEARSEWEQEAKQQHLRTLGAIADAVRAARQDVARETGALVEGAVTTMLSMLNGALPRLCRDHGPAEVRALVERLLPSLRSEPRITIRVHPSLVAVLDRDLANAEPELIGTVSVLGAPVEPGDLRVTWENGSFKRDTRAILAAMQDALSQLGLLSPLEITPERSMERAE
jgi:hypothetical protein